MTNAPAKDLKAQNSSKPEFTCGAPMRYQRTGRRRFKLAWETWLQRLGRTPINVLGLSVTLATGCGGDTGRHLVEAGGGSGTASHTGGTSNAGGTHGTGGTTGQAGNFATGGATPVAGATSAGGTAQIGGSGGSTGGSVSTGGASSSGGATNAGTKAMGGANTAGGTKATGGTLATGGSSTMAAGGSGGTKATGGATTAGTRATGGAATGGTRATGGTGGAAIGGTRATGGAAAGGAATGGTRATGGAATGGTRATGGGAATGGTLATGGATTAAAGGAATGGAVNSGGTNSSGGSGMGGTSAVCPDLSLSCGDTVCQKGCETVQSCAADCGALVFANGNARRVSTPIWVTGDNIAECGMQPMTGLSTSTAATAAAHAALCGYDDAITFPHTACTAFAFGASDQRYYTATGDWDPNFYKGECAQDGYVVGIGAPASGVVDALLCCTGHNISHANCATVSMYSDDAVEPGVTSGDWDPNYHKGECGPGRYVAGVAVNKDTLGTHSILCCSP
jgi:hypothetical protein